MNHQLHQLKQLKRSNGFSLLEVLISIAILTALLGIGAPYLYDSYQRENSSLVATNLVHLLETARERAVNSVDPGGHWGVHIDQNALTMTLFTGKDYGANPDYDEVIAYPMTSVIDVSLPTDIIFAPRTGEILSGGTPFEYKVSSVTKSEQIIVSPAGVVIY